ncbi:CBS domain-containing protein [Paenibacillus tengchongensis]|uniref:CBS domain-containing protein n=1 Tax=Paenibacillus tengchongensis TaxID=2608684 RepID=UPI00124C570F|nr:hypothetical protein [Paenibacillus tengchongensis]
MEKENLRDVLLRMQHTRVHMAAVTDMSGTITGIVMMEDLLEEIVGNIRDESLNVNVPSPQEGMNYWLYTACTLCKLFI